LPWFVTLYAIQGSLKYLKCYKMAKLFVDTENAKRQRGSEQKEQALLSSTAPRQLILQHFAALLAGGGLSGAGGWALVTRS
jgi:hypothetical protein